MRHTLFVITFSTLILWQVACSTAGAPAGGGGDHHGPPPPETFTLTLGLTGMGTVVSSPAGINCPGACTGTWDAGTAVTLTAAPAKGQEVKDWGGDCSGTALTCAITLNADATPSIEFDAKVVTKTATLAIGVSGPGTVTGTGLACPPQCAVTDVAGTVVALTATPAAGQSFATWAGACSGSSPTCSGVVLHSSHDERDAMEVRHLPSGLNSWVCHRHRPAT